jgi:hypothetical protein
MADITGKELSRWVAFCGVVLWKGAVRCFVLALWIEVDCTDLS